MSIEKCRNCESPISPFISFGQMPIANNFLSPEQFSNEFKYELQVQFCEYCGMVQLGDQPEREQMFHENYAFFSSTSRRMMEHFKNFSDFVKTNYLKDNDSFVVEMGSNDGIMLKNFSEKGIRHLGIEPSSNVAEVARKNGVNTICEFFDENLARKIAREYGMCDAFLAANVMCHIPYLHSVAEGIKILLKPNGVLIFEDPYLGDIIEKTSYDQIYDEHVFYFSVNSISNLFREHGLEVIDVQPQKTHGGSMRYILAHEGKIEKSINVVNQLRKERNLGLRLPETYDLFRQKVEESRDNLKSLLERLSLEGKRVVGYAATSKSTTVTNYCGITPDLVEFISDTTPIKQGKFSPGTHIPVLSHDVFKSKYPDYALLFGWNHAEEIIANEVEFVKSGGKWIVYVPHVQII